MSAQDYIVGKVKPNYDSTIRRQGKVIHVHRPVFPNNVKSSEGWQFSYQGVPISTLQVRPDNKAKAVQMFDEMSEVLGDAYAAKFAEVHAKNRKLFKSL